MKKKSSYLSSSVNVFIPQSFVHNPLNLKQKETEVKEKRKWTCCFVETSKPLCHQLFVLGSKAK